MEKCWYRAPNKCAPTKNPGCEDEYYYCSKDSDNYHKLCDRVWNITDDQLMMMSVPELEKLEEDASVCVYLRQRSQTICIHPKCRDSGHEGAIKKVQNKIRRIKRAKYQKEVVEPLFQKWLANPEDETIYDEYISKSDKTLEFPKIENVTWEIFLRKICDLNHLNLSINKWPSDDPIFPNQWGVIVLLPTGEEYTTFSENKEESCQEMCSDLVNVFCSNKTYRRTFWQTFKPPGWYDYKTGETVKGSRSKTAKKNSRK